MSKEKAAKIASLSDKDFALYKSKRNHRSYWQRLSHKDWVAFCKEMAEWFKKDAPDEWNNYVVANKVRKVESDRIALEKRNKEQPRLKKRR